MVTKDEITATIKAQFANVRERGRVMAQALKARADIAATRRRLRSTCADLGEEVYARMSSGAIENADLEGFKVRIDGLHAELNQREKALKKILEEGERQARERKRAQAPPVAAESKSAKKEGK